MPTKRKTVTSSEVKARWIAKAYQRHTVSLRYDTDAELIEWLNAHHDQYTPTDIFRAGLDALMKETT